MNWTQWNFPTELSYAGIDKMSLVCVCLLKSEGFGTCHSNSGRHSLSPSFLLLNFLRVLINTVSKKSSHSLLAPQWTFIRKEANFLPLFDLQFIGCNIWFGSETFIFFKVSIIINSLPDNSIFKISYWVCVSTMMSPFWGKDRDFCAYTLGLQPNVCLLNFRTPGTHKTWFICTRYWLYILMKQKLQSSNITLELTL